VPGPPTGADLLVKVSYAALNPADAVFMGIIPTILPFRWQPIIGLDFSGTVVAAGPDASPADVSEPGTKVCGTLAISLVAIGRGTLAEYVLVPASLVAPCPKAMSLAASSGLGVVGQTVFIAVREAGIKEGDRVLVNGASGGLGTTFVQVCKKYGATVVGVCSEANSELVKKLGADEVSFTLFLSLYQILMSEYQDGRL
jgi:NADPH:quinone reductase-like Zn-dependent oxidoreductase